MPVIKTFDFLVIISSQIYPILSKNVSWPYISKELAVCVLVWSDREVSQYISFHWNIAALLC